MLNPLTGAAPLLRFVRLLAGKNAVHAKGEKEKKKNSAIILARLVGLGCTMSVSVKSAETEAGLASDDDDDDDDDEEEEEQEQEQEEEQEEEEQEKDVDGCGGCGPGEPCRCHTGGAAASTTVRDDFASRTFKELRELCKAAGVPQFPGNKAELIARLRSPKENQLQRKRGGRRKNGPRRKNKTKDGATPVAKRKHACATGPSDDVQEGAIPEAISVPVRELVPTEHAHGLPELLPEKKKPKPRQAWRKHGILANAFRIESPNGGEIAVCLSEDVLAHPSVCSKTDCALDCCKYMKRLPADQLRRYSTKVRMRAALHYTSGGKVGYDSFLADGIELTTRPNAVPPGKLFSRKLKTVNKAYRCTFCRTCNDVTDGGDPNHTFGEDSCPKFGEATTWLLAQSSQQCVYFAPPLVDGGRRLRVSRSFFEALHIVTHHRISTITATVRAQLDRAPVERTSGGSGGHNKLTNSQRMQLSAMLEFAPRELSHYSKFGSNKKTQYLDRGVTRKVIWWNVCTLHDPDYVEQALRHGYRHSYDDVKLKPSEEQLDNARDNKKLRMPKISYDAAKQFFARFDVKFNKLRVDTCETCSKYAFRLGRAALSDSERAKVKKRWQAHLHKADSSCVSLLQQWAILRVYPS